MEDRVIEVFDRISEKYDLLDSIISWGLDQHWRKDVVRMLDLKPEMIVVDCGAGTGKLSAIIKKDCPKCQLNVVDINERMLRRDLFTGVKFYVGSVENIPMNEGSVDRVASAFLTRNVQKLERYFSEVYRILKKGGIFVNLDIFNPTIPVYRDLFGLYFFHIVPAFGNRVTSSKSYSYLANSVRNFVSAKTMQNMLKFAGFGTVEYHSHMLGAVNVHVAIK